MTCGADNCEYGLRRYAQIRRRGEVMRVHPWPIESTEPPDVFVGDKEQLEEAWALCRECNPPKEVPPEKSVVGGPQDEGPRLPYRD